MNKYLSSKIKIISLIAMIAVVFAHAYNWVDDYLEPITSITEGLNYSAIIEYFISNGIVRFSVPIFFVISGYLFFRTFECSFKGYVYKLKCRFKSLVIPYFIWSALSILLCNLLINLPIMIILDWKEKRDCGSILPYLLSPPPFQFWFIIELLKYVIIAPVIYLIIKNIKLYFIIPMFLAWVIAFNVPGINIEALLFFYLGSYIAIYKKEDVINRKFSKKTLIITSVIWISLLSLKTIYAALMGLEQQEHFLYFANPFILLILHQICILLGVFVVWYGFDIVFKDENKCSNILNLSRHTFFIYAFHVPLLNIIFQSILLKTGNHHILNLLIYVGSSTFVILLAIALSSIILKYFPTVHKVLSGNRGNTTTEKEIYRKVENEVIFK